MSASELGFLSVSERNYQEMLASYIESSRQFSFFSIDHVPLEELQMFMESCGQHANSLCISFNYDMSAHQLIFLLNLMPNLKDLTISLENDFKIAMDVATHVPLRLLNLRKLLITRGAPLLEFFSQHLAINSISSLSLASDFPDEKIEEFFKNQCGTLEKLTLMENVEALKFSKLLHLKELQVLIKPSDFAENRVTSLKLRSQPYLKHLSMSDCNLAIFKEICNDGNIKSLYFNYFSLDDGFNLFKDLIMVQKLQVSNRVANFDIGSDLQWISHRFHFLNELDLPDNLIMCEEVLKCFPRLKKLNVMTLMKLNLYAKHLPHLEELTLRYVGRQQIEFCELDSGICHTGLKTLKIWVIEHKFWNLAENILDIATVFTNIESFSFCCYKNIFNGAVDSPRDFSEGLNFFVNLKEFEKLNDLQLRGIPLKFAELNFGIIAEELKKIAQRLRKFECDIVDHLRFDENWENFSYNELIENVQDIFNVQLNEMEENDPSELDEDERAYLTEDDDHNMKFSVNLKSP